MEKDTGFEEEALEEEFLLLVVLRVGSGLEVWVRLMRMGVIGGMDMAVWDAGGFVCRELVVQEIAGVGGFFIAEV